MKLRTIALVLTVVFAFAVAHAQTGVYVTADTQQFNQMGIDAHAAPGGQTDRPLLIGTAYGVYYDVSRLPYIGKLKTGRIVLGIDGRGDTFRLTEYGSQFDRQDGIFSIRVATKKPLLLKTTPYLQGGFGIGHTRIPFRTTYNNNFIYQVSLGADRKLRGRLDWRAFEVSAGALAKYPTGYYSFNGGAGPNQSNYLLTFGTGLVFRSR
jgi:hypothetical protein